MESTQNAASEVLFRQNTHTIIREESERGSEKMEVRRGELYYADLSPVQGSEQGGIRPVLILQNDVGNKYSPTVIAGAVTSRLCKAKLPTHIEIKGGRFGITKDSVVLLEQLRTLDKKRLKNKIGKIDESTMERVNRALLISLGFYS